MLKLKNFHHSKSPMGIDNVHINKLLLSEGFPYRKIEKIWTKRIPSISSTTAMFKKAKPLCIELRQIDGDANSFKETTYMSFFIKYEQLIKK